LKIAMIMLAAGNSRRFGANKLLYEVDGIPMYRHVLGQLIQVKRQLEEGLNRTYTGNLPDIKCRIAVVTQYDSIAETAVEQGIQVLYNPHPEKGISSSLKIGLNANLDADAVLFTVSDQPWLTCDTICKLIQTFLDSGKEIACISCQGKMGNPCIFSKKYYEELLSLEGDKGGKRVIMKHLEDTCIYEVNDARELEDIDYCK
jgi:molybdenum cofactor cytidylyltransferase